MCKFFGKADPTGGEAVCVCEVRAITQIESKAGLGEKIINQCYLRNSHKRLNCAAMREKAGMSRYLLAKEAEVDYAWLRRFEMGKSGIRVETLLQLAKGLGMPAGDIMSVMEEALRNPEQWIEGQENSQ